MKLTADISRSRRGLAPEMAAFETYLRGSDELLTGNTVEHIRLATSALRARASRSKAEMANVSEDSFEGFRYRVYDPGQNSGRLASVFYHGGSWTHLDIDVYDPIIRRIAMESGAPIYAVDYPLAPEVQFPLNVEFCVRFARHVSSARKSSGADDGRLGLAGDSSGANLALATAMQLRDDGDDFVAAIGLAYGVYDLVSQPESFDIYGSGDLPLTTAGVLSDRELYVPDAAMRTNPLVSPLKGDLQGLPPTYLAVASHDALYDENLALARELGLAGVDVTLRVYPGMLHGFFETESLYGSPMAKIALHDLGAFMGRGGGDSV